MRHSFYRFYLSKSLNPREVVIWATGLGVAWVLLAYVVPLAIIRLAYSSLVIMLFNYV